MAESAVTDNSSPGREIRSAPQPVCYVCGTRGEPLYDRLHDRLFSAPGEWDLKRCPQNGCGLIWLDPQPLEADIAKAYTNYYTHGGPLFNEADDVPHRRLREAWRAAKSAYLARRFGDGEQPQGAFGWLLALPVLLTRLECDALNIPRRYLAAPAKGRLLDVGCGDGSVLMLAESKGWEAVGVDVDPDAVAHARRRGLTAHSGRLADQRFAEAAFDLVLMNHVIEHVHDPLGTLKEIRRILRPDGQLVVTTPNADSWGHRHFGRHWRELDPPRHLWIFNARALAVLAKRAGFTRGVASSTLRVTPYLFIHSRIIRRAGRVNMMRRPNLPQIVYGQAAGFAEMMTRVRRPLAAEELLFEVRK